MYRAELDMGPFLMTQSNPIHKIELVNNVPLTIF